MLLPPDELIDDFGRAASLAEMTGMTSNLDRMHIFVRAPAPEFLTTVELYVRARIGSVYEGSA